MSSKISDQVFHILLAVSDEPRHGYAIAVEIEERTGGVVRIGTGTLYTALKRLRDDGLIREQDSAGESRAGRPRRTYALTPRGRSVLDEQMVQLRALLGHARAKRADTFEDRPAESA